MGTPAVSVVVPAYNAARYIDEALRSVLRQTSPPAEIIVVDDGSTDETARIVRRIGPAIRYVHQANAGLAAARNTGIRASGGDTIALLDADDLWEPRFLEVLTGVLDRHPEAAAAYAGFRYVDREGNPVGSPSLRVVPPQAFHRAIVADGNWLSACAVLFRKRLALDVGLFDEALAAAEDEDLWIRMSAQWPFVGVPAALVRYRRHGANMSDDPERMVTARLRVREKNFGPLEGGPDPVPASTRDAYRSVLRFAAARYLACGNVKQSAEFVRRCARLSRDDVRGLSFWRAMVRAHAPEVEQFDRRVTMDWTLVEDRVTRLLDALAEGRATASSASVARMAGAAYLAMADEAGRGGEPARAAKWLRRAARADSGLIVARAYWGTIARSAVGLCGHRSGPGSRAGAPHA